MKYISFSIAMFSLMLASLFACSNLVGGDEESELLSKSLSVFDAHNIFLGYGSASGYTIQVYSPKSYFYIIDWNGQLTEGYAYFTQTDCGGTPFLMYYLSPYGKTVTRLDSKLYAFRDVDANGVAIIDGSISGYWSAFSIGTISNMPSLAAMPANYHAFALTEITKSTAGIPETVYLPIRLEYE